MSASGCPLRATAALAAFLSYSIMAQIPGTPLAVPPPGQPGFVLMDPGQIGVQFTNHLSDETASINQIRLIGSGVALGDVDGDGWCDVYLCRLEGPNALYRNLGQWRFQDVAAQGGVSCPNQFSTGCALADLDGDGDLDLLVNALGGGTRLFRNDGFGQFQEEETSGLGRDGTGTTLALADVDGDGDLDVYVVRYRSTTIRSTGLTVLTVNGQHVLRPEDRDQYEFTPQGLILEHGEVDHLYLNDGTARFTAVSWKQGRFLDETGQSLTAEPKEWGLSAMFRDVNGDGKPDLYVCNDFWSPDRFWINHGGAVFQMAHPLALRKTSTFSMGVDFADIDRDGDDDFLVLDMLSRDHPSRMRQRAMAGLDDIDETRIEDRPQADRNTLQLNRGDGTFAEIAQLSGLQASDWSWSAAFIDVDLDGYEDVLVTTGHGFDTQDADTEERIAAMGPLPSSKLHTKLLLYPRLDTPNHAFRNRGDLTFEEVGDRWGFNHRGVSHGMALGDLDGDGDLDVVLNNLNGPSSFYRNESSAPRIAVRLEGARGNRQGIGARIELRGASLRQSQEMVSGGRYLSCDAAERVFAVPPGQGPLELEVIWPGGKRTRLKAAEANRRYLIKESDARPWVSREVSGPPCPWFVEVGEFGEDQAELRFDDLQRQTLLPRRYSRLGPSVAWLDLDGDGLEDLVIGVSRGESLTLWKNSGQGTFQRFGTRESLGPWADDQGGVIGYPIGPEHRQLLVAQSNYESPSGQTGLVHILEISRERIARQAVLSMPGSSSPGPMALADVDGDGDLDLFVGGRIKPARYPEPVASALWLRETNGWELAQTWEKFGMVSGAVFNDLDADGYPELVLACEWGPVRILRREGQIWEDQTQRWGLAGMTGWWNGVTAGDFDEDGRMDIVASNWGRNHPYQSFLRGGVRLHAVADEGGVRLAEAYRPETEWLPWRDLGSLSREFPWLRERYRTYHAFGQATFAEAFKGHLNEALQYEANWLDTTLFLNRGDRFEAHSLPLEAQFAPAFGVSVADADGDGHEDLFLGQNFFSVGPQTSRLDAGRGLWLHGDGRGGFEPMSAAESGVAVYGDQRGTAVADYDGDGRIDLAVGQAGGRSRLFRNIWGTPGLRVRLKGPSGNPNGAGAVMWWTAANRRGPAREVHLGSGYWGQDGTVQVLGAALGAERVVVRWPGGRISEHNLEATMREVTVE